MTALDTKVARDTQTYLADYERLARNGGAEPDWMRALREGGLAAFAEQGFPTIRNEDWKYTSVAPITGVPFRTATADGHATGLVESLVPPRPAQLIFVNGHSVPELSAPPTTLISVAALADLPPEEASVVERELAAHVRYDRTGFTALNTALFGDLALVHIPAGWASSEPIYLTFVSISDDDLTASHPRVLIVLEEGAQASVVEMHLGVADQRYFANEITEIALGAGASLEYCKLVRESTRAYHVGSTQVHQGRDSQLTSFAITTGGSLVRNDLNVVLDGEGAGCSLYGLYLTQDAQHVDNHTLIEHARPHGTSRQLYKGVLDGTSRAVFNGKIIVDKEAQKTDAQQANRNLLLSGEATIDTKPQLEILADDVKCTHGAAIGQLDEEVLFYLRSRGMSEPTARSLLTYGFASEVVGRISAESVRERLTEDLRSMLRQGW